MSYDVGALYGPRAFPGTLGLWTSFPFGAQVLVQGVRVSAGTPGPWNSFHLSCRECENKGVGCVGEVCEQKLESVSHTVLILHSLSSTPNTLIFKFFPTHTVLFFTPSQTHPTPLFPHSLKHTHTLLIFHSLANMCAGENLTIRVVGVLEVCVKSWTVCVLDRI